MLFIGFGNGVNRAINTAKLLGMDIAILDLKFVKPLDTKTLKSLSKNYKKWFIFSDSIKVGGVTSAVLEFLAEEEIFNILDLNLHILQTFVFEYNHTKFS